MKISQLLSGLTTMVTNEEHEFLTKYSDSVRLSSLSEHEHWLAQNLVRKGHYNILSDNNTLTKNEKNN